MISDDQLRLNLLQYLAGDLSAQERVSFEERLLTDQDFSDTVAVHEQDLIDAYALGSLTPDEARTMQTWVEASPYRIQRVRMARALLIRRPQKVRRKKYAAIMLAAAACFAAAVGITLSMTGRLIRQRPSSASSGTIAAVKNPTPDKLAQNVAKPEVILLVAERTRGQQPAIPHQLHRGARAQLQIILVGETARSGYSLRISPLNGKKHASSEYKDLNAEQADGHIYLKVELPPNALAHGAYRVLVSKGGDTLVSDFAVVLVR